MYLTSIPQALVFIHYCVQYTNTLDQGLTVPLASTTDLEQVSLPIPACSMEVWLLHQLIVLSHVADAAALQYLAEHIPMGQPAQCSYGVDLAAVMTGRHVADGSS